MENNNLKLSVVLATYNEAANLTRCLESIKEVADEIVVVDGESSDDTVAIAKAFGAKVISTTNKAIFHINKQMAMDEAIGDWVLQLDADEVVDKEMNGFLSQIKSGLYLTDGKRSNNGIKAYYLKRKNFFLGKFLTKGGQYPDPVIRLYERGKARLPSIDVHEQMVVDGEVAVAPGHLLHYNAPNFTRYITNANRYTSLTAQQLYLQGVKINWQNNLKYLVIKPMGTFLKLYVRHRGYVDGFSGFIFALFSGFHHAIAYMKCGDKIREATLDKVKETRS